jgi:hypothetical protein
VAEQPFHPSGPQRVLYGHRLLNRLPRLPPQAIPLLRGVPALGKWNRENRELQRDERESVMTSQTSRSDLSRSDPWWAPQGCQSSVRVRSTQPAPPWRGFRRNWRERRPSSGEGAKSVPPPGEAITTASRGPRDSAIHRGVNPPLQEPQSSGMDSIAAAPTMSSNDVGLPPTWDRVPCGSHP